MKRPALEVGDVFRAHGEAFLDSHGASMSAQQKQVMRAIAQCRTAALGGHVSVCDRCGHEEISYNSCRNRHCPKCQASAQGDWLQARTAELLPVPYFHAVCTLPDELGPLALQNKAVVYGLLLATSGQALSELAADPQHLGARIGCLAVLHTWSQNLLHHPHVHCVVPGGGLALDRSRWIPSPPLFFLPVRALSALFRGKFLAGLKEAYLKGSLRFHGQLEALADRDAFFGFLAQLRDKDWVVYVKPPYICAK